MKSSFTRIVLALVVLGVMLIAGLALNRPATASAIPPANAAAGAPAFTNAGTAGVKAIGTFVSANQATLAFQAAGRVKEIKIKEGEQVHVGDLLASLDTGALDFQVAQAQASVDAAQSRLDQLKNPSATDVAAAQAGVTSAEAVLAQLKTSTPNDLTVAKADLDKAHAALQLAQAAYDRIGGASNPLIAMLPQSLALQQASDDYQKALAVYNARTNPSDSQLKQAQAAVDQARAVFARLTNPGPNDLKGAQAQVAQAQAALDLAKQNLANARIAAPLDGTILWVGPHIGESASPGAPAITIADLTHMQVQVGVDENALAQVKVGQTATITADALPDKTLSGRVSKIGMLATTTAGIVSVPVTLDVDAAGALIAPGLSATVEINTR